MNFKRIYLLTGVLTLIAAPAVFLLQGSKTAASLLVGALFLSGIFLSWQLSVKFMIKEDPPAWTPLIIILRYGLIGSIFYAIIHGRLVLWAWFVAGSVLVVIAVALTAVWDIIRK